MRQAIPLLRHIQENRFSQVVHIMHNLFTLKLKYKVRLSSF